MAGQCAKGNKKLQVYRECFQQVDKNNDGFITCDEMVGMLRSQNCHISDDAIEETFKFFEGPGGDKRITFEEFCTGLDRILEEIQGLYVVFNELDKDKSGFLDRGELTTMLQQGKRKYSKQEIDAILKEADTNGDGQICFEEFMAAVL